MSTRKPALHWELLPIFLVVLAFSLGFVLYGERLRLLDPTGIAHYGEDGWREMGAWIRWGIPLAAAGAYALLSFGMWAVSRARDPLGDVNFLRAMAGKPRLEDPALRESVRARLLRGQYLCKIVIASIALGIQGWYCGHLIEELGRGGP